MKIISQGKYEIFTTKDDAIKKFMQLQGVCREEISGEKRIHFYCSKKGKIVITNPPSRNIDKDNSTELFAEIIEQDGKVYVDYYTSFSKPNNIFKCILLAFELLLCIFAVVLVINTSDIYRLPIYILGLLLFGCSLFYATKEKRFSPIDSEIMINELKKRVEAVNLWDK